MANDAWSYVQFTGLIILINQCAVGLGLFISSFSPNPLVGLSLGTTLPVTSSFTHVYYHPLFQEPPIDSHRPIHTPLPSPL
jgi:hypothetical protein